MSSTLLKPSKLKRKTFLETYYHQNWSLPDSIIYYITKNPPSWKFYQKLVKLCKYFFIKNPILIIETLYYYHLSEEWVTSKNRIHKSIDLKNIASKFWLTEKLEILDGTSLNFLPSIIPKFYQIDVKILILYSQILTFDECKFLFSNVEYVSLNETILKFKDDAIVPLEKVVEILPKVKEFNFIIAPTNISSNTVKELLEIPHFSKIDKFELNNIPETFDIETFFLYLKEINHHTKFSLNFDDSISERYKKCLGEIVDEILGSETHAYKPPYINFEGLSRTKKHTLMYWNNRA